MTAVGPSYLEFTTADGYNGNTSPDEARETAVRRDYHANGKLSVVGQRSRIHRYANRLAARAIPLNKRSIHQDLTN